MQFEFEYGIISEMPKKLVIIATNLIICYLIIKISNNKSVLITRLISLGIRYQIFFNTNSFDNSLIKLKREIIYSKCISRQF